MSSPPSERPFAPAPRAEAAPAGADVPRARPMPMGSTAPTGPTAPPADHLREEGRPRSDVLEELEERLRGDFTYASGRIVGTMIAQPHPFAREVFARYLEKNVGDPGVTPATAALEREAVRMLGELLGHPGAVGHVVSGGNEANILALWAAKTLAGARAAKGRVIVPASAHVSWDKAARLLDLELVRVPVDAGYRLDFEQVRRQVDARTIALVGAAGSTDLGLVDPIERLSELALERGLHLHVDAAFGGFVLPFLAELGHDVPPFDFSLPGVASITIDPHKMGLCVQPAGALLFRTPALARAVTVDVPYLAGGKTAQATLTGTRTGAAALAVWAMLAHLGRAGYRDVVRGCMERTAFLVEGLAAIDGVAVLVPPTMNIVGLRPTRLSVAAFADALRAKGWTASQFPTHVRVVVLPHLGRGDLESFLGDVAAVVGAKTRTRRA